MSSTDRLSHRARDVGSHIAVAVVCILLSSYRLFLSPLLGRNCRYAPSCSVYALQAVRRYGVLRGGGMALRRLARCHPFRDGGWDPVT